MSMIMRADLDICIPTFKRPELLALLLQDLALQSVLPKNIIVIDGDPESGAAKNKLRILKDTLPFSVRYVASNHANLAYQRYLGYLASGSRFLLFLDDDLRVYQVDALKKMIDAFAMNETVVAATANIRFPESTKTATGSWGDRVNAKSRRRSALVDRLGASANARPGQLTPTGNRIFPIDDGSGYSSIEWLSGGVMAFKRSVLDRDFFSDDLFALTKAGCGLGEDTYLGRMAITRGDVIFVHGATFDHPNADEPKAYPIQAYRMGFATSYSRWFINNIYRGKNKPTLADRLALFKGLVGGIVFSILSALKSPAKHRFSYALGYATGALKGIYASPSARRLSPGIDWRRDADVAILTLESIA